MSAVLNNSLVSDVRYRTLTEADAANMAEIERDAYAFPWSEGNFRDSLLSGYRVLGGFIGAELVSYAVVMAVLDEAHLLNLAVKKRWQRCGLGAAMLRAVLAEARAARRVALYLEVRPSNAVGRHLYARFGFTERGLRRDYYPAVTGREDALFLGLDLEIAS